MDGFKVAKVALNIALDKEFDYSFSAKAKLEKGKRVLVNFNNTKRVGIITGLKKESEITQLKPIIEVLDVNPVLNQENFKFAKELSRIYPYPAAEFLFMMLPSYLKKIKKTNLEKLSWSKGKTSQINFIKSQSFLARYDFWKGKVKEKLKEGSVIICFPQVSFLKEAQELIRKDFGDIAKEIYSYQSEKELYSNWIDTRQKSLILGTRLAIFYYPRDLSLIVIEEENSPWYFQEEKPFYHLLDVAILLAKIKNIDLVLSADFPTVLSYHLIERKKIFLNDLDQKKDRNVKVIERKHYQKGVISPLLSELLRKNIEAAKRIVVIWNKKGFAGILSCSSCGHICQCHRCSAYLRLSLSEAKGVCPYCGRKYDIGKLCSVCNSGYIRNFGLGIERVELILKKFFPDVRIGRWEDRSGQTQIIISTSKILSSLYKRESFDVGFLLDIDSFLCRLDFDAAINTFFYLEKLSTFFKDELYVFTQNKNHYLFKNLEENWTSFYKEELRIRKKLRLPPFGFIAKIILRGKNKNNLLTKAQYLYNKLEKAKFLAYGPFEEYPFKLRGNFRYLVVARSKTRSFGMIVHNQIKDLRAANIKIAVVIR